MSTPELYMGRNIIYLKCSPKYFADLKSGLKQFEVRKDDRNYRVGDLLTIREYCTECEKYSGDETVREVAYVLRDFEGLKEGWCVLGLVKKKTAPQRPESCKCCACCECTCK